MADIRGFTSLSSRLDPEDVLTLVNNFLAGMTEVIIGYGGTIDEFIGDAILVLFGAPRAMENHAERAVACAIEMQSAMASVNELNVQAGLPSVETGIGINTGEVVIGNIGSETRSKYGVVGHHVNFTSRIESYAQGGQILVSERTQQSCKGILEYNLAMTVEPKGIDGEVNLFEVLAIRGDYNLSHG